MKWRDINRMSIFQDISKSLQKIDPRIIFREICIPEHIMLNPFLSV